MPRRAIVMVVLLACGPAMSGCVSNLIAKHIAAPTNGGRDHVPTPMTLPPLFDGTGTGRVGPPPAELAYFVVQPRSNSPRGTVLALEGWGGSVTEQPYLRPLATALAEAGYRVVMPDLRGQGLSTGKTIGVGAQDAVDLSHLITVLQSRKIIQGPIGVLGHSYGAGTAILLAARDQRIKAVVALSAWKDWVETAPITLRAFARRSDSWILKVANCFIPDSTLIQASRKSCALAGVTPADASPRRAMPKMDTPVLLIHGENDPVCLAQWSRTLYDARPRHTRLMLLKGETHWSYFHDDRLGEVQAACVDWFEKSLKPAGPGVTHALSHDRG